MDDKRDALIAKVALFAFDQAQKRFLTPNVALAERRGERLGLFLHRVDRKHRERTVANLQLAFPEWEPAKHQSVALDVYRHWGRVTGDFLRSPIRTDEEVISSMDLENIDILNDALTSGRGILAVTGHFGNFERFGHWCHATGRPLTVVQRDANQGGVQDRVAAIRNRMGMKTLSRGSSAKAILTKLRNRELVGMLPDQNAGDTFSNFFGKPCGTVLGPAVLSIRTKSLLLPAFCVRTGVGRYRIMVKPVIPVEGREKDPDAIMADYNALLESVIRDYPDQYLWMHDRWKSARRRGLL